MSVFCYFHQNYHCGTPTSRLALLYSIVVHGRLNIDDYRTFTSDVAYFEGHYYSDKAPAGAFLALPGFAIAYALTGNDQEDPKTTWGNGGWLLCSWVATASSAALIAAAGAVFYFHWLLTYLRAKTALATTIAVFLGSAPFPYSTMLFTHAQVVGLLSMALWAIDRMRAIESPPDRMNYLIGFVFGLVLALEFTAGIIVVGLLGYAMYRHRSRPWTLPIGAVPPLLLIPIYSLLCFGSPFVLGYSYQATFPEMQHGLFGIKFPNLAVLGKLLFGPERGLFFWSPFYLMAIPGILVLGKTFKQWFWIALSLPLLHILVISGNAWDWRAGWTLGPRYLAPALPILGLAAGIALERFPLPGYLLAIASVFLTGLATAVDATPKYEITNPLLELHIPGLLRAHYTQNLGKFLGLSGHWQLAPLATLLCMYSLIMYRALSNATASSKSSVSTEASEVGRG
jgi:hypothetical protein